MQDEKNEKTIRALACIAQNFDFLFSFDIETGKCENIATAPQNERKFSGFDAEFDRPDYKERMSLLAASVVYKDDLMQFLERTSLVHVMDELKDKDSYIVNYRVCINSEIGYFQSRYVRNVYENEMKVIVAVRDRTEEIEEIKRQFCSEVKEENGKRNGADESLKVINTANMPADETEAVHEPEQSTDGNGKSPDNDSKCDNTEQKQEGSRYLYNLSHSFRTPLSAILGFSSMAGKYSDNPERVLECVNKISKSGKQLLSLVNNVLDMARIVSGKLSVEEVPVSLYELTEEITNIAGNTAVNDDSTFSLDMSSVTDEYVYADRLHLQQALSNLIDSALKHTNTGGKVRLKIVQGPSEKEGYALYSFIISDTGIGMSKDFLNFIFDPKAHENAEDIRASQGCGIGMNIARQLIELMGGSFTIDSEKGVGTKAVCEFEFKLFENRKCAGEDLTKNVDLNGRRALLVEDNDLNREIVHDILEDENVIVEDATDGAVAVDMVYNSDPGYYDYILMDIQMPYMDGYAATREIRAIENSRLASIPIIAMTANSAEDGREKAKRAGMDDYLTKPVDGKELIRALKRNDRDR